jgi:hypothetical protein
MQTLESKVAAALAKTTVTSPAALAIAEINVELLYQELWKQTKPQSRCAITHPLRLSGHDKAFNSRPEFAGLIERFLRDPLAQSAHPSVKHGFMTLARESGCLQQIPEIALLGGVYQGDWTQAAALDPIRFLSVTKDSNVVTQTVRQYDYASRIDLGVMTNCKRVLEVNYRDRSKFAVNPFSLLSKRIVDKQTAFTFALTPTCVTGQIANLNSMCTGFWVDSERVTNILSHLLPDLDLNHANFLRSTRKPLDMDRALSAGCRTLLLHPAAEMAHISSLILAHAYVYASKFSTDPHSVGFQSDNSPSLYVDFTYDHLRLNLKFLNNLVELHNNKATPFSLANSNVLQQLLTVLSADFESIAKPMPDGLLDLVEGLIEDASTDKKLNASGLARYSEDGQDITFFKNSFSNAGACASSSTFTAFKQFKETPLFDAQWESNLIASISPDLTASIQAEIEAYDSKLLAGRQKKVEKQKSEEFEKTGKNGASAANNGAPPSLPLPGIPTAPTTTQHTNSPSMNGVNP